MKQYLADLHIHTCLSPCGSLEMSPSEIVRRSLAKGLDAIAITDHNTTLQCIEYNNQQRYSKLLSIHGYLKEQTQYSASDAHCPEQIGTQPSIWQTEELTFDGLRKAFDQKDNHLIFASHG